MNQKDEPIGSRIKQIRKRNHLTQKEMGERMLVSGSYISKLEKGYETPSKMFIRLFTVEFITNAAQGGYKMNKCELCDAPVYIKVKQYLRSACVPVTRAQALRDELLDLTGEMYVELPKRYCPVCGNRIAPED